MNTSSASILSDITEKAEDLFIPPKVDIIGVIMMLLVGAVSGLFVSVSVMIAAFFSTGRFSIDTNISQFFLSFFTFFAFCFGGFLYLWLSEKIFPSLYQHIKISLKYIMMYFVILYIVTLPMYLMVDRDMILMIYLGHTLFSILWVELIAGVISQYRYVLLAIFSNITAIIFSGGLVLLIAQNFDTKDTNLFIMMGLAIITFALSSFLIFLTKWLYYQYYTLTGQDPLGRIFYDIETQERQKVANAGNTLLQK